MSTLTAPLRESENYNKIVEALQLDPSLKAYADKDMELSILK